MRTPAGILSLPTAKQAYGADGDMVRITGYLVKRSEMEKYNRGEVVLQDNLINGSSNYKLNRLKDRKVRSV